MLSGIGDSKNHAGHAMGRFDLIPGVEKEGFSVYRQAHSERVVPTHFDFLLYRWDEASIL